MQSFRLFLFMLFVFILVGCDGDKQSLSGNAKVEVGPYETYYKWIGETTDGCELIWGTKTIESGSAIQIEGRQVLDSNYTVVSNLEPATNYIAQVVCNGEYSSIISTKTLPFIEPLTITTKNQNGEVTLDWTNPVYDNLNGYMVYIGKKNSFTKSEALYKYYTPLPSSNNVAQQVNSSKTIPDLLNNETYYVSVAPLIGLVESKLESFYEVKPILDTPQDDANGTNNSLDLNITTLTPDSISFDWGDIQNTTAYTVYLNTEQGFGLNDKTTSIITTSSESNTTLPLLDCGRTYFLKLAGRDTRHIGPTSEEYSFTLPELLTPQTVLSTVRGNGEVTVNWTNVNHKDLTSYTLYVGDKPDFSKAEAVQVLNDVSSGVVVKNLINNKPYFFSLAPNVRNWECAKESTVTATPELDITTAKVDMSKTTEAGKATWVDVNITRQSAMVFWERIKLATGYTIYFSTKEDVDVDDTVTIKREIEGIDTLNTIFENLSYNQVYYYKVEAKDSTHQGPVSAIYRFDIGDIGQVGKKLSKLNDTGVYENNASECASMREWIDCKKPLDSSGEIVPFGQDGFYATGTKDRGKSVTEQGSCFRDDASKLLWYEADNRSNYTYYQDSDGVDTGSTGLENIGTSDCKIYDTTTTPNVYCNSKQLIEYVNHNNPIGCNCDTWRLPTRDELRGMVYYGKIIPNSYFIKSKDAESLETKGNYKPSTSSTEYNYWSSDYALDGTSENSSNYAWSVNLLTGEESIVTRKTNARVVLVCADN